jgi:hypothetical protein
MQLRHLSGVCDLTNQRNQSQSLSDGLEAQECSIKLQSQGTRLGSYSAAATSQVTANLIKTLFAKNGKYNSKLRPSELSLLDFPDETIDKIFGYLRFESSVICLALTCKRLFAIFDKSMDDKVAAKFWNNTSGPWKEQLMVSLAKGWAPKHKTRLCYACWRLTPYGPSSRKTWEKLIHRRGCAKPKIFWELNWEVTLWTKGTCMEDVHDNRIRCPLCVFYDENVRFTSAKYFMGALFGRKLKVFPFAKTIEYPREHKACLKVRKSYLGEGVTLTRRRLCRHAREILKDSSRGWYDRNRPLRIRVTNLGRGMIRLHLHMQQRYQMSFLDLLRSIFG